MKKFLVLTLLGLTLSACQHKTTKNIKNKNISKITATATRSDEIVVASLNTEIENLNDIDAQRELMLSNGVQVFGLQEVDRETLRYEERKQENPMLKFAQRPYFFSFYGSSFEVSNGDFGNAIVSQFPIKEVDVITLTNAHLTPESQQNEMLDIFKGLHYDTKEVQLERIYGKNGLIEQGAIEPNSVAKAILNINGKTVSFYTTQLTKQHFAARVREMKLIKEILDNDLNEYKILTGDFNTDFGINEFAIFADDYKMANGYNGVWFETIKEITPTEFLKEGKRVKFFDNIITTNNIDILDVKTVETSLSDHLPIIAKLKLN